MTKQDLFSWSAEQRVETRFFFFKTQTTRGAYETAEIKCHTSETKVLQLQINAPWKYIIKGKTDSSGP